MNAKARPIQNQSTEWRAKCIEALTDAIKAEPESIFVLYRKDGKVHYRSVFMNRLEEIGAIEVAKQELWLV